MKTTHSDKKYRKNRAESRTPYKIIDTTYAQSCRKQGGYVVLNHDIISFLDIAGLSQDEVRLYDVMLYEGNSMTAQDVATKLSLFPSAVYRLFYALEELKLVQQTAVRPKAYTALLPHEALPRSVEIIRQNLLRQIESLQQQGSSGSSAPAEIIIGRQPQYERFMVETSKAEKEIVDHSIGIAYSDEMYNVIKSTMKRGVEFRFVFQQYRPENFHILHKWKELGLKMRHVKADRGFHISIFDKRIIIITFSNPENTDDRISIVTSNTSVLQLFLAYFEALWLRGKEVEL